MQAVQNIQQDEFKIRANIEFWQQFHYDFQLHSSHLDELREWAQLAMLTLYSQILSSRKYQHALEKADNQVIGNNNLVISLFENDLLRVNLVSIKLGCGSPLHDHPGTSGAMMVITGDVRTIVCEQTETINNLNQSRSLLKVVENKVLTTGESRCFTQDQHNIHRFEALTDRAVLMIVHAQPFAAIQQSYFFTANPQQKIGSQILAQRVRAQAFQKFRQNKINTIKDAAK